MSAEDWMYSIGYRVAIALLLTAMAFGATLASFWALNQTQFFAVDIELFLDEFAVPFFITSFVLRELNQLIISLQGKVA